MSAKLLPVVKMRDCLAPILSVFRSPRRNLYKCCHSLPWDIKSRTSYTSGQITFLILQVSSKICRQAINTMLFPKLILFLPCYVAGLSTSSLPSAALPSLTPLFSASIRIAPPISPLPIPIPGGIRDGKSCISRPDRPYLRTRQCNPS